MMRNFSSWLAIIGYDLNLRGLYPLDSYKISYCNNIVVIIASLRIEALLYIYLYSYMQKMYSVFYNSIPFHISLSSFLPL